MDVPETRATLSEVTFVYWVRRAKPSDRKLADQAEQNRCQSSGAGEFPVAINQNCCNGYARNSAIGKVSPYYVHRSVRSQALASLPGTGSTPTSRGFAMGYFSFVTRFSLRVPVRRLWIGLIENSPHGVVINHDDGAGVERGVGYSKGHAVGRPAIKC
jgi:hypothetical protein